MLNTDFWKENGDPLLVGVLGGTPFPTYSDPPSVIRQNAADGDLVDYLQKLSRMKGLDPEITYRQIYQESKFDPNATSKAGAQGIAQFMPDTARRLGLNNPYDPHSALETYTTYMQYLLRKYGNYDQALAAYNSGEGRVDTAIKEGNWFQRVPSETKDYVAKILGYSDYLNDPSVPGKDITADASQGVDTSKVPKTVGDLFTDVGFLDVIGRTGVTVLGIVIVGIGIYLIAK